jgi:TolB-like protein/DNA-binding winged helix-turn-helix (wHTH) protein
MQPSPSPDAGTLPPRFLIDDLEVDIGKAEVRRGGGQIPLPKLSFDLLCALAKAAPAIVTTDDLLQRVWPGLHVSPESVAQRVKLLRGAIGDDSQQPRYILGVRGRGYRLIPVPAPIANLTDAAGPELARTSEAAPSGILKPLRIAAALLVTLSAVAVLGQRYWSSNHQAAQAVVTADRSIAVLPFVDMSERKDQEYFADGMAEEILNLLAKIPGLKVIGRTSSFQFKGQTQDLRAIGEKLGARYVLEGSVRKSGDHLRVTAQLINSLDGTHLWSQTYDRELIDVLKMQDEIAANLVRALQIEVRAGAFVSRSSLRNTEAYTVSLLGMHASARFDQQGFEQALSDFQRALDLDPTFVPASIGLAWTYYLLGQFQYMPAAVALEQSRGAAEQTLKLDPKLAIAHALLARIHLAYDRDWPAAEQELQLARALAPNDDAILAVAVEQTLILGHWEEGLKLSNKRLELDPLNPGAYFTLSWIQLKRERLAEAESAIRRTLEISPTFSAGHYYLGLILLGRNQADAALAEFAKERDEGCRLAGSTRALSVLGRKPDSDTALAQTLKDFADRPVGIAGMYAFRGELDDAFKWLGRAFAQKDATLYHIKSDPQFQRQIESDSRYSELLKKMNLPE